MAAAVLTAGCGARTPPATTPSSHAQPAASARPSRAVTELRSDLSQVFGAHVAWRGVWGVSVRSLDSGESLFTLDADKLMMPASNNKILTLSTAAETLGWDYRYTTTLETSAPVENGVLRGDLIVRGSGDPSINSRNGRAAAVFAEWLSALDAAGIRQIDGRVIGDDQAFDDEGIGAGWAWDYLQYDYAAPVGALQFNEDVAPLTIAPGAVAGSPAIVALAPGAGLAVVNRVRTGAADGTAAVEYRRRLDRPELEVTGSIPLGAATLTRSVAVVNPTLFFVQSFKDALIGRGITVSGAAVDLDDVAPELMSAGPRRVLATTTSPPLSDIATVLMKVSQNLYAETLLKTIGRKAGGLGTVAAGQEQVHAQLRTWGVPDDAYVFVDGSGLSRYNYVTASMLVTLLEHLYHDPKHRELFTATLPIAGKDGTIANRMRRTRAEGNAVAKTGSISNVRTLSGYVRSRDGEMLVFSILANDFVIPSATIGYIADLAVETLSNFTRK